MTIEELNKEAFELINLVVFEPKEISQQRAELVGSSKERGVADWSEKLVEGMVKRVSNVIEETVEIYFIDENGSYGLDQVKYVEFNKLIKNIHSLEQFNQRVSLRFVEAESFIWIIETYKKQQANGNLSDYLIIKADEKVKRHTFYFPVINLEIEEPFRIGTTEFTYFTKDYFDRLYKVLKAKDATVTEDNFQEMVRKDFQGQVIAKVTINADRIMAEELAKRSAEISVNVLKLYSESVSVPQRKTMFDLNYKLVYQIQSDFLTQRPDESDSLAMTTQFNIQPFNFTRSHCQTAFNSGLTIFSDYISLNNKDELHEIIIQSIHLFATALSNWDLHLRCVNLITILESIFLQAEEYKNMEHKTKARLSKSLTNQHQKKERLKVIFTNIYQVRHKMIHKAIRIEINSRELSEVQINMVRLFHKLIEFNTKLGFKDKATLIQKLNKIPS